MIALALKTAEDLAEAMYACWRTNGRSEMPPVWARLDTSRKLHWLSAAYDLLNTYEVPVEGFRFYPTNQKDD
jgi:hypothetical protein